MPYFDKQKKVWVAQIKYKKRKYRSFHQSKTEAKKWEVRKREDLQLIETTSRIPTVSLLEFATRYLDYSKSKHASKTYHEKKLAFRLLFSSVDPRLPVGELHQGAVLFHLQQQAQERSGNAANKDRKNLIAAWNWAQKYIPDFPGSNPFLVDRFPETRSPRYVPPESDFWKVYDVAESEQDRLMLLCFLHLAARRNEIFYLRREDVDFKQHQIRLYTRKRRDGSLEYDWLPMTKRLSFELDNHLSSSGSSEWVFPNPDTGIPYIARQKWMPRLCRLANVKPFGLHAIRHLTASILVKNDVSLIDIQTILRHKKLTTTERYIHRLASVRSALEVLE